MSASANDVATRIASALPIAMREARRWLVWKSVPHTDTSKKPKKVPYYASGKVRFGTLDTPEDRARLVDLNTALARLRRGGFAGLGFALGDDGTGNYWQGIDLDGTDARPELAALVERLPGYVERSPSGTGWHAVGIGRDFPTATNKAAGIEAYSHGRYFTVTGDAGRGDVEDIAAFVSSVLAPMCRATHASASAGSSSFFAKVNAKALASLGDWVPTLFPKAVEYHDGYRISSADLGRKLEEDISIVPAGIRDFGEEEGRTPIDLVIDWSPARDATEAARWLCDRMRVDPKLLGWGKTAKSSSSEQADADGDEREPDPYRGTDDANAGLLLSQHGNDIRYCPTWEKWLTWTGTHWAIDTRLDIERRGATVPPAIRAEAARVTRTRAAVLARLAEMQNVFPLPAEYRGLQDKQEALEMRAEKLLSIAKQLEGHNKRTAMLSATRHRVVVTHTELDGKPLLLNCANGTVDLATGALRPHDRADLLAHDTGIHYDPRATAPTWQAFLQSTFAGDAELIEFVQRAVGYSLTGDVREQVLLICHGVGSNGKSVFLNILRKLLGSLAWQAAPDLLMSDGKNRHPTEQADLFGKRAVVCQETGEGRRFNETLVKQLTGGDAVTARRMREDFWSFQPTHKLWLSTNHKPEIRGTDYAIWRRIRLIPFSVQFTDTGPARKDPEMEARLASELPGILAWAVEGCRAWLRDGLRTPAAVMAATEGYQQEMDVLAAWMRDCCVTARHCEARAADLYASYCAWASQTGEHPEKQRKFGMRLKERGFEQFTSNGAWWRGIGLAARQNQSTEPTEGTEGDSNITPNFFREASLGTNPESGSVPSVPSVNNFDGSVAPAGEAATPPTAPADDVISHHACGTCRHSVRAADSSAESWRTCSAGQRGGWPNAETWCAVWAAGDIARSKAVRS